MITNIRTYLKRNAHKTVLWIVILALGFGSLPTFVRKTTGSGQWVFRINGQEVSQSELVREMDMQRQRMHALRAQYGQLADAFLNSVNVPELAQATVQQEELLNQASSSMGLNLSEEYIAQKLQDPYFTLGELAGLVPFNAIQGGALDQAALRQHLARKGMSMRDFERKVERVLVKDAVLDMANVGGYVTLPEIKAAYAARYLDKKFSYFALDIDGYSKQAAQEGVSPDQLAGYYQDQNTKRGRYVVAEKRTGVVWTFHADDYGIDISDSKIEQYYQDHKAGAEFQEKAAQAQVRTILLQPDASADAASVEQVRQKAAQLRAELVENPSLFAAKAKELSHDTATKDKGGLLPMFSKGESNGAVERAAFILKAPGAISEVIETERGFEIIQLVEKTARSVKSLGAVKSSIKKKLLNRAFEVAFAADMRAVAQDADKARALEQLAHAKKAKKQTLSSVELDNKRETKTLFDIKKNGDIGFYSTPDTGVAVSLENIAKSYTPQLADREDAVRQDYFLDKARMALLKDLKKVRAFKANNPGQPLADIVADMAANGTIGGNTDKAATHSSDWIKAGDQEALKKFLPKNTPTKGLLRLEKVGASAVELTEKGGILITVEALGELDIEQFELKRATVSRELEMRKKQVVTEGFVASLYKNATIEAKEIGGYIQE
jgi:parvulin-like peptidyl-prolyl isomerase